MPAGFSTGGAPEPGPASEAIITATAGSTWYFGVEGGWRVIPVIYAILLAIWTVLTWIITPSADREAAGLAVDIPGARQVQAGSRPGSPAGTAGHFEPVQAREVRLIPCAGARRMFGFRADVSGPL